MRVALVTTSAGVPSPIGAFTRRLVPELAERCELRVLVDGEPGAGEASALTLDPREHDHVVYSLGNEAAHAFMLRPIRDFGGTVLLHEWRLTELARHAFPALTAGGVPGHLAALREGGVAQMLAWRRSHPVRGLEREELTFNRSVVRFGDSFLVHTVDVKRSVLVERNASTAVGVLQHGPGELGLLAPAEGAPGSSDGVNFSALAAECIEYLERMPAPRAARKASVIARVRQELALRREEQAQAHP